MPEEYGVKRMPLAIAGFEDGRRDHKPRSAGGL